MCPRVRPVAGRLLVLIGAIWLGLPGAAWADPAPRPVLHLADGSYLPGNLRDSNDPKILVWNSQAFARPLEFPLSAIQAVHYAAPAKPKQPTGEYCFELVDGDIIYGDLLALTDDEMEVNAAPLGRLHLQRDQVRRVSRRSGADSIYVGPNGLAGWTEPAAATDWRDEGGQLYTDRHGATLFGDLGIPEKAVIELDLSWKAKADFVLSLAADGQNGRVAPTFRFEVWDGVLVVVGESTRDADMAILQETGTRGGEVRVQIYLDQQQRKLILVSRTGKILATLNIKGAKPQSHTGVQLTNGKGDVRLEHLRVTRWNGTPPRDVRDDQSRLHRADGSIVYGQLTAYNPESKQFTIHEGAADVVVSHEAVGDLFLAPSGSAKKSPDAKTPRTLRVANQDGSRFSGALMRVEAGHLTLSCRGVKEDLRMPLADIRSLIPLRHDEQVSAAPNAGREGRLEMDGISLKGRFVDAKPEASLMWQPDLARSPSQLLPGLSGRIVYREPPPPPPPVRPVNRAAVAGGLVVFGMGVATNEATLTTVVRPPSSGGPSIHLRTGDTIPCEVTHIDEKGVTFKAPQTAATFVASEKIKSVELRTSNTSGIDEAKRDRLLTLPRMQRDSPPTHLICSKSGDFLRGRIVEMDESRLKIEVRLETRVIPRDRIAQIIWLHADELGDQKAAAAETPGGSKETRAQTLNSEGNRMTFVVAKSDEKSVSGTSDVLGACQAKLSEIDQLLFGSYIERSAADVAYNPWKLHNAPDPKFVSADAAGGGDDASTGNDSPLVGQAAALFQLDLLDGAKFKLADHKNRIVVLDFWATWCGPCMQSMPLVDEVIRDFVGREVDFVAVNMEEQPEQVKSIMERHKFKMSVALDRDGAVAGKYAVTAIPQTVVIGRDGKVARLFVGGGKATADSLRKVLQELTAK